VIRNVHERLVPAPVAQVGALLDRLGGPDDVLWPTPAWEPMVLDGPVAVGAAGGHGPIRYRVTAHEPGRRVEFTAAPGLGLTGTHTFTAEPAGPGATLLRHVVAGRTGGVMLVGWPLVVRPLHDALLEDLLDNAEQAVGTEPPRPARWSPYVRLLNRLTADRAVPTAVPATPLLATALPRVDWADAYAVPARPGTPVDPQVWADAVFRDPPRWVFALLGLREALVGFVGIDRGGASSFDTVARADDEVLLGTDERHLDFRASVRREPARVVLTTVVRVHNTRGRAYSALVRRVHPAIVRAMLTRAAHRLSRSSNRRGAARPTMRA
jgi:Protein of unknown function (DUF2867)